MVQNSPVPIVMVGSQRSSDRINCCRGRFHYNPFMKPWLRRCASFAEDADSDAEFWRRFTPEERVSILEQMRREWLENDGRVDEGLRRVARVLDAARR